MSMGDLIYSHKLIIEDEDIDKINSIVSLLDLKKKYTEIYENTQYTSLWLTCMTAEDKIKRINTRIEQLNKKRKWGT